MHARRGFPAAGASLAAHQPQASRHRCEHGRGRSKKIVIENRGAQGPLGRAGEQKVVSSPRLVGADLDGVRPGFDHRHGGRVVATDQPGGGGGGVGWPAARRRRGCGGLSDRVLGGGGRPGGGGGSAWSVLLASPRGGGG